MPCERHLGEDTAESYALNRLPTEELEAVERHLIFCAVCQDAISQAAQFAAILRVALMELQHLACIRLPVKTRGRCSTRCSKHTLNHPQAKSCCCFYNCKLLY